MRTRKSEKSTAIAQAVGFHVPSYVISGKEVRSMPITITFHVFGITITVTAKSNNRHSAKWRLSKLWIILYFGGQPRVTVFLFP